MFRFKWHIASKCDAAVTITAVRGRAGKLVVGVVGCALISAAAAAADRCHSPLPGTRSLTVWANVTSYRFAGARVLVDWKRSTTCAGRTVWKYTSTASMTAAVSCKRARAVGVSQHRTTLVASDATHTVRIVLAPVSADVANRLIVEDRTSKRRIASWPLF